MALPDSLRRADECFERVARQIGDEQWQLATPCDDWTVRQLVGHVVSGSAMAAAIVRGASRNEAIAVLGTDFIADEPLAAYRRVLDDQRAAFTEPGALARVCEHPAGDMPGAQVRAFRIGDLVIHTWDLAVAIGVRTDIALDLIDLDLVDEVWTSLQPMVPFIASVGVFGDGPSGELPNDASALDRLLDLTGRRPAAVAPGVSA